MPDMSCGVPSRSTCLYRALTSQPLDGGMRRFGPHAPVTPVARRNATRSGAWLCATALALFAGTGGLELVTELVAAAPAHLRTGGLLALEIGTTQGRRVAELIAATGRFRDARVVRDLAGHDRIVLAESL